MSTFPTIKDQLPSPADAIIAVAREAERNKSVREITIAGHVHLVDAMGRVISLEPYEEHPYRKRAITQLYEVRSFVDYLKAHVDKAETHIFGAASEKGGSFTAVLDYHPRDSKLARTGEHMCQLALDVTPEWKRWLENDRKLLSQQQFAEFIEENLSDIVEPDGATILELSQLLQGKKEVSFKSGRNLRDGGITLQYVEDIKLNGGGVNRKDDQMQLPDRFTIGLVPFVGGDGVSIAARLRFRIGNDGAVSFAYVLDRPYKVIEAGFSAARDRIESEIGLPVHLGKGQIVR